MYAKKNNKLNGVNAGIVKTEPVHRRIGKKPKNLERESQLQFLKSMGWRVRCSSNKTYTYVAPDGHRCHSMKCAIAHCANGTEMMLNQQRMRGMDDYGGIGPSQYYKLDGYGYSGVPVGPYVPQVPHQQAVPNIGYRFEEPAPSQYFEEEKTKLRVMTDSFRQLSSLNEEVINSLQLQILVLQSENKSLRGKVSKLETKIENNGKPQIKAENNSKAPALGLKMSKQNWQNSENVVVNDIHDNDLQPAGKILNTKFTDLNAAHAIRKLVNAC